MTDPHSIENTVPIPPYLALPSLSTRKPPASSEYSTVSTEVFPVQAQVYSHGHMSRTNPRPMTPPCTESDTLSAAQRESGTKIGQSMCKLPSKWRPQFYPQCPVYRADGCAVRNRTSKANSNKEESPPFLIVPVLTKRFTNSSSVSHGFVMMTVHRVTGPAAPCIGNLLNHTPTFSSIMSFLLSVWPRLV